MRQHVLAAVAVAVALAVPATALADWGGPSGSASLAAQPAVPAGSLWDLGAAPACRAVEAPPEAPAGEAPVLVGAPGGPDQWCWAYARLGAGGALSIPGGVPGERLSPSAYARQTGQTVVVAYQPGGGVIVYLSS